MAFEETREQQQMYNYFRSCIYIFLIIEIIMNLPVTADNRVTQFVLDLLARFKVFNSVSGCKVAELICICIVCIGTKAEKSLKFNVRTMVIYPVLAGLTLVGLCFVFHGMSFGFSWLGFPANRLMYAVCSVVGTMLDIRDWTVLPSITTTRLVRTVSILKTNRSSSLKHWSAMIIR